MGVRFERRLESRERAFANRAKRVLDVVEVLVKRVPPRPRALDHRAQTHVPSLDGERFSRRSEQPLSLLRLTSRTSERPIVLTAPRSGHQRRAF
jgi:hypothetical protein